MSTRLLFVVASLCLTPLSGCGKSGEFETAPVVGTVAFDGKRLSQGTVVFIPEKGKMALGVIQSDGSYSLETYVPGDGAIVGPCRAEVRVITTFGEENELKAAAPLVIPARYSSVNTSGLTYVVEAGKINTFEIALIK